MYFAYRPLQKHSAAARVDKGSTVGTGRMFGCFTTGVFVSLAVSYYSPGKKQNKKFSSMQARIFNSNVRKKIYFTG